MTETQTLVLSMLLENTGTAMLDSGGDNGRMWQRNALKDLPKEPPVSIDMGLDNLYTLTKDGAFVRRGDSENELLEWLQRNTSYSWDHAFKHEGYKIEYTPAKSDEVTITVSLFHYLPTVLELDAVCDNFNAKFAKMADWDSDIYGVSAEAQKWLERKGFTIGDSWNTYNKEDNLSQTLQGTELKIDGLSEGAYVLLQVHGGADVRGGYTDAKLFKYQTFQEYLDPTPTVWATLHRADGSEIELDMRESGNGFVSSETGEPIELKEGDSITASL